MKIELHILQNFAPANLNRDDTGAPKDCEFGGVRRARISSQCLKRAVRTAFEIGDHIDADERAARTKRLVEETAKRLAAEQGFVDEEARALVAAALTGAGFGVGDDHKTQYLIFLPRRTVAALADFIAKHADALRVLADAKDDADGGEDAKKRSRKSAKRDAKAAFPKELASELQNILRDATRTPELALFGRMIADKPDWNVDAACQVAHAISTNRVVMDFDFYTAVDDFKPGDTAGSDMMGTIQFNSSCFYRYAVIDTEQLARNLGTGDRADVARTVEAFVRASVQAIPTGKQNSMAAQNPPSYVMTVVRRGGPVSLANAFVRPVRPDPEVVTASVIALEDYFGRLCAMYGRADIIGAFACTDRDEARLPAIDGIERAPAVDELIARTRAALEA